MYISEPIIGINNPLFVSGPNGSRCVAGWLCAVLGRATARQERILLCLCHEYWPPQAHDVYRVRPLKRLFVFLKGKSRRPDHPGVAKQCTTFRTKRASKRSREKSETQGQLGNNGNKAIFTRVCFLGGSLLVFSDQPAHRPSCRATVTRD